jgi:hypothetical protein
VTLTACAGACAGASDVAGTLEVKFPPEQPVKAATTPVKRKQNEERAIPLASLCIRRTSMRSVGAPQTRCAPCDIDSTTS